MRKGDFVNKKGFIFLWMILFLFSGCLTRPETDKSALGARRVVGYFPAAAIMLEQYNPGIEYLTHINLWFFNLDRNGQISAPRVTPFELRKFIAKAHARQTRVFISIGGGHVTSKTEVGQRYLQLFRSGRHRVIIDALLRFADSYGIDGIDLDFEGDMMIPEYNHFVTALAKAVSDKPYRLSGAFGYWGARKMSDAAVTAFDFLNLMIYNESGLFDKELKDHSSFAHVEKTIDYWQNRRGIDRSKLVIGVPFYGWQRIFDAQGNTVSQGSVTFRDVYGLYPGKAVKEDFLTLDTPEGGRQVITYNSLKLIREKSHYARAFGGIMIWHIAQDTPDLRLLRAIYSELIE